MRNPGRASLLGAEVQGLPVCWKYFLLAPDSGFHGPWCTSSIPLVLLKYF